MQIREYITFDADDKYGPRKINGGYLIAMPRVARTGVQNYRGKEMGKPSLDTVKVFRSESEVFDRDGAFRSLANRPITIDHPDILVDASNWRRHAVGQVGSEVVRDGEFIRVPIMLMDEKAIKAVQDGKRQLSVGYTCDIKWEAGKTDDGEEYDAIQTGIRANHLAIVATARGGARLIIGDDERKEPAMDMKTIVVDGIECQVADVTAAVITKTLKALDDQLADAKRQLTDELAKMKRDTDIDAATLKTQIATKEAEVATLKTQLAEAQQQTTPEKLDAMVSDRVAVIEKAHAVIGDAVIVKDKTIAQIRRQVVDAKLGATAQGWGDEAVTASFDTLASAPVSGITATDVAVSFSRPHAARDERASAYNDYLKYLTDGWKQPQAKQ